MQLIKPDTTKSRKSDFDIFSTLKFSAENVTGRGLL